MLVWLLSKRQQKSKSKIPADLVLVIWSIQSWDVHSIATSITQSSTLSFRLLGKTLPDANRVPFPPEPCVQPSFMWRPARIAVRGYRSTGG
jgi:hypothetical protein